VIWFVYCFIGQKSSTILEVINEINKKKANWFTNIVIATASEVAAVQFLAPYIACSNGEFIRDVLGGDSVVIYDDLSKHAVAYRQLSLLLRRSPGREAFPGDVFFMYILDF